MCDILSYLSFPQDRVNPYYAVEDAILYTLNMDTEAVKRYLLSGRLALHHDGSTENCELSKEDTGPRKVSEA
jgi:hypothetical protein